MNLYSSTDSIIVKMKKKFTYPKASAFSCFYFDSSTLLLRYIKYKDSFVHKVNINHCLCLSIDYIMKFCYGTLLVMFIFALDIEISFMESFALFNIFSELVNLEKCVTTPIKKLQIYIYIYCKYIHICA